MRPAQLLSLLCFTLSSVRFAVAKPRSFASILDHYNELHPESQLVILKEMRVPAEEAAAAVADSGLDAYEGKIIDPLQKITYKFVDFRKQPLLRVTLDENAKVVDDIEEDVERKTKKLW